MNPAGIREKVRLAVETLAVGARII